MAARSQDSEGQSSVDGGGDFEKSMTEGPWNRLVGLWEMAMAPVPIGAQVYDCFWEGVGGQC